LAPRFSTVFSQSKTNENIRKSGSKRQYRRGEEYFRVELKSQRDVIPVLPAYFKSQQSIISCRNPDDDLLGAHHPFNLSLETINDMAGFELHFYLRLSSPECED
jgi:hypothetical protein